MTAPRGSFLILALCLSACAAPPPPPAVPPSAVEPASEQPTFTETGAASWYGVDHQGLLTALGERFDMNQLTAAHRTLPLNTIVRVTNTENQKTVKVRINDRGPYAKGRIMDLSARAAKELGVKEHGIVRIRLEVFASDQKAGV